MQFITFEFYLFFLGVLFFLFPIRGNKNLYKVYLLVLSLFFYYLFGLEKFLILIIFSLINYLYLLLLYKKRNKKIIFIGVLLNIIFLAYYKYTNFFSDIASEVFGIVLNIEVFAPIGISFYTFRVISHIVDSYNEKVQKPSILNYLLYISYFPQILSGPIMRANEFYIEINKAGKLKIKSNEVIILFLSGFIKKFLISSILWDYSQQQFSNPIGFSSIDLIIGVLAYSCLIYTDFSGYSDISIGISRLLGISVDANFNSPYRALSLKDFWSRWHISLSKWLRDYVYIPLGGSRTVFGIDNKFINNIAFIPNILITMFISGFWHGAGLTFIVWGLLHGIGSVFSSLISKISDKFKVTFPLFSWILTFTFINFTWIFFNSRSLEIAVSYMSEIFYSKVYENSFLDFRVLLIIFIVILFNFIGEYIYKYLLIVLNKLTFIFIVFILIVIVYIIVRLGPELMPPFIYFSF